MIEQIGGTFREIIKQKELQGKYALANPERIDYRKQLLLELSALECSNDERREELRTLSWFIRNKLWDPPNNTQKLYVLLHIINVAFQTIASIVGYDLIYDIDGILEYVSILAKYKNQYAPAIGIIVFEEITDQILKVNQSEIIKSQWDDILDSANGMTTFIHVFDDIFTNAITKYENKFIRSLTCDDLLTRCKVKKSCDENRFIPQPNTSNNRWNPPGKTFLYLAPKEQIVPNTPNGITGGQYVCLLECRTNHGTDVCFCDFIAQTPGRILDLSYNDEPMYTFRLLLMDEEQRIVSGSIERLLNNPDIYAHRNDKDYIYRLIKNDLDKHPMSPAVITESIAKQYLKSICSCIYTKVDDSDQPAKNRAYKSFHILAEYLESKGITGIIYPCTRTDHMDGKNIVLFDLNDAKPVIGSVVQYHYN